MNAWSRWRTAAIGAALIAATNAVALIGVAYNRSGEPESALVLSKREIARVGNWGFRREDSGLELGLRWRVPGGDALGYVYGSDASEEDGPSWIDRDRLASLGFAIPDSGDGGKQRRSMERQQSRDALVVLELDGPAYRNDVARARRRAEEARERAAAMPDDRALTQRAEATKKHLVRMESEETRLYIIDAGPDLATLRAKYPDRMRHAIVHAEIRPLFYERKGKQRLSVSVRLTTANIIVPLEYRDTLERSRGPGADVKIAFGKRLEPWIVAVQPRSDSTSDTGKD
jgi:hypothetical protein